MLTVPLPEEPSFEQLRKQARELQRAVRAGEPEALAELAERYPRAGGPATLRLTTAQAALARRYGFPSWARLKRHVEIVERYARYPGRVNETEPSSLGDRFLRLACMSYHAIVGPERWAEARAVASQHPEISAGNVHVAAVLPDTAELARILGRDPAAARREGGPYRWEPLYYLAYARHDPDIDKDAVLEAARLLLAAGADPNVGYLWLGHPPMFTALTGVFGEGELGPELQPRHPHSLALGRLLLEAGADPNDEQALYNRMFQPGNDHLELLFEFGLGSGAGGPWEELLGDDMCSPEGMLGDSLHWAISHGLAERVTLLLDHGVQASRPFPDGNLPTVLAAIRGHAELVSLLTEHGAVPPELSPSQAVVAAILAGDRAEVRRLRASHRGLVTRVRDRHPGLVPWAATLSRPDVLRLLVDLGWDINAKGRTDGPSNQAWDTALHHAAGAGELDLARVILDLGGDTAVRDGRFNTRPLDWARYFNQPELVDLLEPLTVDPAPSE
ncbi:MAG: ankyrin repeat domain-containing protein [Acidimicrobiales bacterium]